jgi:fumarylpyruvate hydrolase
MSFVFNPGSWPSVPINGRDELFPVHRIYCVGRNYADHAREMGGNPDREAPFFFDKPPDAVAPKAGSIAYPPRTANLHHEVELVVTIGKTGRDVPADSAGALIFGYAVGNDLTRRDLQFAARDKGRPWDTAKGFDHSAPITAIHPVTETGLIERGRIWLSVNGATRQEGDLKDMIWSVPEIIAELSTLYTLLPGDLIFTGTPAGVGPIAPGDTIESGIDGLDVLRFAISAGQDIPAP